MIRTVKKPDERKKEILTCAKTLFLEKGYNKTAIADVMDILNIAKGTIYHYFKSKDHLLTEVVKEIVIKYANELAKVMENSEKNAIDNVMSLITAGDISPHHKAFLQKIHSDENRELHLRILELTVLYVAPLYAKVFEQGCKEKIFSVNNPLETAEFLIGGIHFITDEGFYHLSKEDLARRKKAIPNLMVAMLGAKDGTFDFMKKILK